MEKVNPVHNSISPKLMNQERVQKPKMLVVDDEPDNLDLLYRTFRRDFQVFRADSGGKALEVLAQEGEVAVIISDQRMPQMKGTEFLSRTVPQFPNTMRIILTGFTDVEDLVEAINSGQVYKYITKPWDPNELKEVVQRATETYDVLQQRLDELQRAEAQAALLATIVEVSRRITEADATFQAIASAFGKSFQADGCALCLLETESTIKAHGLYGIATSVDWLPQDPLFKETLSTSQVTGCFDVAADSDLAALPPYQNSGIQAHVLTPVIHRGQNRAVLSLQWQQAHILNESELAMLYLCAQQVVLALA
ncbi:response regulator [Trichothermofontia sp.]